MNVCVCTALRNAESYLDRWRDQLNELRMALHRRDDCLHIILSEGDHTDRTGELLLEYTKHLPITIVTYYHGGPVYGPVVDQERFKQLAVVANAAWRKMSTKTDVAFWIDGDLIWDVATVLKMVEALDKYPAVAPLVLEMNNPNKFYDIWAFRRDGVNFTKDLPFHPDINGSSIQLDSAGAFVGFRGKLARKIDFPREDVFVGLSRKVYENGGEIWLDPSLRVYHP